MRFMVDQAVSPSVARGLQQAGYDAVHVRDLGLATAADPEIFSRAQTEDRTIISADTDFGVLLAKTQQTSPSFLLIRSSNKRPQAILKMLLDNLDRLKHDIAEGCVAVFEDQRIRVRKLPI